MQYLNNLGVDGLLSTRWHEVIDVVENAFVDPTADMVPKIYMFLK